MQLSRTRFKYAMPKAFSQCCLISLLASAGSVLAQADDYDWVNIKDLNAEQRLQLQPGCRGRYIDPLAGQPAPKSLQEANLEIEAQNSLVEDNQHVLMEGDVQIKHGPRSIGAERMVFNRDQQHAELDGGVTIRTPGLLIRGESASMSTATEEADFRKALFVMHEEHMRGTADAIERDDTGVVTLHGGSVTTCAPEDNTWRIVGEEIRLDQQKRQGTARNVSLRIKDVPVIYIPWFSFPLGDERQSGFLVPEFASSESGGLDIGLPWYWNMAPNYDMTITPRLISGRGAMLETENRYLNTFMDGSLNLAYLADDDGGADPDVDTLIERGDLSESEARPHTGNNRWLVRVNQRGGLDSHRGWYTFMDMSKVSDVDYFRDVGDEAHSHTRLSYIDQLVSMGYLGRNWHFQTNFHDRERLLEDLEQPLRTLPEINLDGHYRFGDVKLYMENEITRFDHDEDQRSDGSPIIKGQRAYFDYRLTHSWRRPWAFLNTHTGYKYLAYELEEQSLSADASASPNAGALQAGIDFGLIFERSTPRFIQTLEPRIFRFYRSHSDHSDFYNLTDDGQNLNFDTTSRTLGYNQFYRDTRFTGHDRLDDANRSTLGLTSRLIRREDGRELLQFSVGQVQHYSARKVTLDGVPETAEQREIAGSGSISLGPLSRLYASGIYNTQENELARATMGYTYASTDSRILANISWSWVRDFKQQETNERNLNQIDASVIYPVTDQWQLMARYNYDAEESQHLETFFGAEYRGCCYRFRVLARRWLDSNIATLVDDEDLRYDQGLFFEFQLKGLGGSGARIHNMLRDSIPGYEERERKLNN